MASKKPPFYPARFEEATDFVQSKTSSIRSLTSSLGKYISGSTGEDASNPSFLRKQLLGPPAEFGNFFQRSGWPALKKLGRGAAGLVLGPLFAVAGALTGIPPTQVNTLVGGLNTAEGVAGLWSKFKTLSKEHLEEWRGMTGGQAALELVKRLAYIPANLGMGGLSSFFNTFLSNVVDSVRTVAGGFGRFQKRMKENYLLYQAFDKVTPLGTFGNLLGSAGNIVETAMNTNNTWGQIAGWIAKQAWAKKILSPERMKLWKAYGNDLMIAAANGDKDKIANLVKDGFMNTVGQGAAAHIGGFAKRLGASAQDLERIHRLAQGDLGALNEVVNKFMPGFDVKDAKSLKSFTTAVNTTFSKAVQQFSKQYTEGSDFEKVSFGMKDLLGVQGDEALAGVTKKLGKDAMKTLEGNFETICAKGPKMVTAATDFVKNIQDSNLREKMGFTIAAGNIQEAIAALVQQKASPEFIDKIRTFKLIDSAGQENFLDATALNLFKTKAIEELANSHVPPVKSTPKPGFPLQRE